jgi:hypothetical protein
MVKSSSPTVSCTFSLKLTLLECGAVAYWNAPEPAVGATVSIVMFSAADGLLAPLALAGGCGDWPHAVNQRAGR